jgi:PadR family transcriptional regulator PadR
MPDDVLQAEQGSLYPALHRLIKRGWISFEARWTAARRALSALQKTSEAKLQRVEQNVNVSHLTMSHLTITPQCRKTGPHFPRTGL